MCLAELNVSLLPCRHRWYHLVRSCSPSSNLANCGNRLAISGWEIKCDFCPFCSGWNVSSSEYRVLGNDRAPALTRTPSLSLSTTRRETRRGSLSRTDSNTSITIMAQEKNRAMNARVDAYFRVPPPETSSVPAPLQEEDGDEGVPTVTLTPSDTCSEGQESLRHSSTSSQGDRPRGVFTKIRRKSKRLSMGLFK